MSENGNGKTTSVSIGFPGLLGIVFVVLKLTHVINWSWWWVLAPFWGPVAIALALVVVVAFFATVFDR